MNNTISNSAISNAKTWKGIKAQYITTACGLALAVSAVAALSGDLVGQSTRHIASAPKTATALSTGDQRAREVVFYLVSSDAQANKAQEYEELVQWVRYGTGGQEPNRSVNLLQAGSAEEEARARFLIDDAMAAANFSSDQDAPAFEVVDLRNQ